MNLLELVAELHRLGLSISLEDERLCLVAPVGVVTQSLQICLQRHREALKDREIARSSMKEKEVVEELPDWESVAYLDDEE